MPPPPRSRCHIHDEVDAIEPSFPLSNLFPQERDLRQIHGRERVGDYVARVRASPAAAPSSLLCRASSVVTSSLRFRPVRHAVNQHRQTDTARQQSSAHREISGRSLTTYFARGVMRAFVAHRRVHIHTWGLGAVFFVQYTTSLHGISTLLRPLVTLIRTSTLCPLRSKCGPTWMLCTRGFRLHTPTCIRRTQEYGYK